MAGFSFNAASLDEYSWLLDFDRKNENVAVDDLHEIAAEGAGFTDERGRLEIEFKSRVVSRDLAYVLVAEATDPEGDLTPASGSTEFHATGQSFFGKVEADKSVYKKGDKLTAKVLTVGPGGLAVSRTGTLKIYAVDPKTRRRREVGAAGVSTGVDGRAVAEVVLSESGETVAAFEAKGRHGEDVSIESSFFVSAQAFDPEKNVRVLAERDIYREGETLTAYYEGPELELPLLVTFEADRVIDYRFIPVGSSLPSLELPVKAEYAPNAVLVAAAIRDGRLETSTDPITVIRSLGIELVGPAKAKKPGETAEIAIRTVDQAGRPVAAELGLVVIDRAILALGGLPIPDIRKVFYDVKRGHAVTTTSSVAYRYVGSLTAIDQDLLDEQKQKAVVEREKELLEFSRRESDVLKDLADAKPGQSVDAIGIGAGAGGGLRKGQPLGGSRVQRRTAASGGGVAPGANEPAKAAPRPGEMDRAKSKSNDQRLRDKAEGIANGTDTGVAFNDFEESNGALDEERRATENKAFRSRFKGGEAAEAAANPALGFETWGSTAAPTAPVRDHFADVAYYSELVTTDADGRAVVSFTLPDNLTTWQVRAEGATATTLVGAGKTQLTVSKAVEARVAAPRFLTHKDEAEIAAIFENHGSEKVEISGAARPSPESAGTVSGGDERTATVDAYGSLVLPLLVRPTSPGVLTIAAVAKAGASESDAIDYYLRVLPFGKRLRVGAAGEVLGETVFDLVLAREVLPNTGSLRIAFSRGLGHDLAEATAALLKPARGSIDGLVWRFKPLARIALLLESLGLQSPVKRADLERFITSSLAALLEAQNDDGTFGWWPRTGGDAYMTALALDAMSESTNFAPATFGSARQRALQAAGAALVERATALDAQAYLLFGMRGDAPVEHVNRLTRAARDLSPQGLSWLILSLTALGRDTQAEEAAKRLEGMIRRHEGGTASFSGHATDGFLKSEVESTAWALKALLGRRRSGPDVDALAKRLRDAKRGPGYGTPKETAAVVEALALYAEGKARAEVGGTIDLSVNGRSQKTVEVGGLGEVGSLVIDVPFADVKVGANRIVVKTSRREALRYTAELAGVVGEDEIAAESGAFSIARRITDYVPVERRREKTKPGYTILREEARPPAEPPQAVADLVSGRRYLVNLVIESAEDSSYVVVEDPLPAGVEPIEEAVTGDFFRMERRDDRMVFYFDRLRKGKATVEYPVTASYPGIYRTPAPEAYGLYDSRARGSGASLALRVLPEGRSAAATALAKPTPDEIFAKGLEAFGTRQYPEALERLAPLLELDLVEGVRRRLAIAVLLSRLRTADLAKAVRDHQSATQTTGGGVTSDWALDDLKTLGDAYAAVADFEMARSFYGNVLAANFSTEAQYWRRLAELDRNVEAREGLTRLAARWPDSGDAVQTWIECAESWFAIPDPAIKPEVEVRAEMRGQWKRGLAEMRRVLSHFEPDLDSDLGYRYLDRLRRLGLAERCETEARLYLDRHPTSIQAQDAQHLVMQAVFARGDWSGAEAAAKRLVNEKWPTPVSGRVEPRPSRHVDDARYILGRIAHVRGDIALAVDYYGMVKDRFTDAAQSWLFFNEKKLVLPQVTEAAPGALVTVTAQVKNVKSMQAALYGVDLPLVFAVRKSLVRINQVELTGIAPDRRIDTITGAAPYVDAKAAIELGKVEEGAWLMVVGDGETLRTSLVIVSSLKVVLQRQGATMRCYVTDAAKGVPVAGAEVRLGNGARIVGSGKTDERGILVLEGIEPGVTALAASGRAYALATE